MSERAPAGINVHTPNVARIYDYMLGGKDNFAADREAAEQILKAFPESRDGVEANREFLGNAVRYLAAEAGIRQFVDIGAGLPTQKNVHEVAHEVDDCARTVYVDNDPIVCVHGRALLANTPTVAMVEADLRDPDALRARVAATRLVNFDEPVALLMVAVLHFLEDPYDDVAKLLDMLPPGSHLIITHMTMQERRSCDTESVRQVYTRASSGVYPRTLDDIRRFFGDFIILGSEQFISPALLARFAPLGWAAVAKHPG